jgi:hypothetical protein
MGYYQAGGYGTLVSYDRTGGAYKPLRIDTVPLVLNASGGGNVGIAQTNPLYRLSIKGTGSDSQVHLSPDGTDIGGYLFADSQSLQIAGSAAYQGAWIAKSTGASAIQLHSTGTIFYTSSGLTVGGTFTPTERMRITSAGNVGIGTASPSAILQVHAGTDANLWVRQGSLVSAGATGIGIDSFNDSAASRFPMNIGGQPICLWGNVGISNATPGTILHAKGSSPALQVEDTTGAIVSIGYSVGAGEAQVISTYTAGGFKPLSINVGGSDRITIGTAGTIAFPALPSVAPAAGSKQIWYDPADSNRLKYVP